MPTAISKFMSRVITDVPGAPDDKVREAVIDAAVDFCEETRVWNEIQDAVATINGVDEYEFDLPSGARPIAVEEIWCGTNRLVPITMKDLQLVMPDWQTAVGPAPRFYNSAFDWDTFRIYPKPADVTGAALRIQGSFQPTDASEILPDVLWNRYREAVCSGAKARLLMMPKNVATWSDPAMAAIHSNIFAEGKSTARIHVAEAGVKSNLTVTPRRFGY